MTPPAAKPRRTRVAGVVAKSLRDRILAGAIGEGDLLPKQEELMAEFGVGSPCIREAFRILETERLVTVLRGKVGGASVHPPHAATAAYMLGLVLQFQNVRLSDLLEARSRLEPLCAASCASRPDRATAVLPALRDALDRGMEAIDEPELYAELAREFHAAIVANCGNATIALVVGTLEWLWQGQARTIKEHGAFADRSVRLMQALGHEKIYRLISEGDAQGAMRAVEQHFTAPDAARRYAFDSDVVVTAEPDE
jgi:GntR family transcriptional regulator, transcriptional repressor for pyruvate dehydrogenase complex